MVHLLHSTLSLPNNISNAIAGNFSGSKQQEIAVSKVNWLQLLKPDSSTGKIILLSSMNVFGIIRSLTTIRMTGTIKDYLVISSDSGKITILEFNMSKNMFERVHLETFGKAGVRRIVPGEYLSADPKGRAVMIGAVEKQKFVYVLNRDSQAKLTISSPLEAHKSHTITHALVGLDVGFENPMFACIEMEYPSSYQECLETPGSNGESLGLGLKKLVFYELDLGLNHIVRKSSQDIPPSSNYLISVPGGSDGPSGVLVCFEGFIEWRHLDYSFVRVPIPFCESKESRKNSIIVSSVVHKLKKGFFILIQNEFGDLFKITMDYSTGGDGIIGAVDDLKIKYFDSIPTGNALVLLKSGFLFLASEFGNNLFYQVENLGDDDEETEYSARIHGLFGDSVDTISHTKRTANPIPRITFKNRDLTNISLVYELDSLCPIIDSQVENFTNDESPQFYMLCGVGSGSSFRILRHGLTVSELAVSELPGNPNAIWTVKTGDGYDSFIIVSFVNATLVLAIGETVEEVSDTGFLSSTPTLAVGQLGEDSLVQVYPSGIRHIRSDKRVSEWRTPGNRIIERASTNQRQVAISLSGGEVVYFELDSTGQLNEYQDRKEMTSNVTCLALGPIPKGRLRSRFLAIGCADNTVRILSVDPDTCLQSLSMQAITATPESLVMTQTLDPLTGSLCFNLNIGLVNGVFLKTLLDSVTGQLSDSRLRFVGTRPVKLFRVVISGNDAVLVLSSRPWLSFTFDGRYKLMPLSYDSLEFGSSFCTESCPEGIVAVAGNTLRIFGLDKLEDVFDSTVVNLDYTPKRFVFDGNSGNYVLIESGNVHNDHVNGHSLSSDSSSHTSTHTSTYPTHAPLQINGKDDSKDQKQVTLNGIPKEQGLGSIWKSKIRVLNPISGSTIDSFHLDTNEAAFSLTICSFSSDPTTSYLLVGTAIGLNWSPYSCQAAFVKTFSISLSGELTLIHSTPIEDVPLALTPFKGKLLVGLGSRLRLYELGKKKLLRKAESSSFANRIVKIEVSGYRLLVSDMSQSVHFALFHAEENKFIVFTDDSTTRWMTCSTLLDYSTVAGGDKFGNFFVNRVPLEYMQDVEEDPTGTRLVYQRGYLTGALVKFEHLADFHVGDTLTSLTKKSLLPGAKEIILYTTLHGAIGMFVPLTSKDDVEFFQTLEMHLRNQSPPLCGRDHVSFRSSYFPVRNVIDADMCELYNLLPNEKKRLVAESLGRSVNEISKKLEDVRNRVAF